MNVYIFQAALLCEECGKATCEQLRATVKELHPGFNEADEYSFDSDYFPKGPYTNSGGEADSPQHCGMCSTFLENPLTRDGLAYVAEQLEEKPEGPCAKLWREFYADALAPYISGDDPDPPDWAMVRDRIKDDTPGTSP